MVFVADLVPVRTIYMWMAPWLIPAEIMAQEKLSTQIVIKEQYVKIR
jgi:hypothetical protein